jgi:hypothetical protein
MLIGDRAGRTLTVTTIGIMLERSGGIDTWHRQLLEWVDRWISR